MFNKVRSYLSNLTKSSLTREDGFGNYLTGLGTAGSRSENSRFIYNPVLKANELTNIYTGSGIGKRIINLIVEESTRDFIEADADLIKELTRLKFKQKLMDSAIFGRLYGGALLVCFVDDGRELYNAIDLTNVNQVVSLRHYDKQQITWSEVDLVKDVLDESYGYPEIYTINPIIGQPFRVHRSRCHLFGGDRLPNNARQENLGWDNSVLQALYQPLRDYCIAIGTTSEIIQDFVQVVLKVEGLAEKLLEGGQEAINTRLSFLDQTRSVQKTAIIDASTEDYLKVSSNVSGIADLTDRLGESLCAAAQTPFTKIFGRSPAGMNATGKADETNWYNFVNSYRSDVLSGCIEWFISIVKEQKTWKLGKKPRDFEWFFPALETPDHEQEAKINLITAQTDQIYIDRGGLDASEVAKLRYANGTFNTKVTLSEDSFEVNLEDYEIDITEEEEIDKDNQKQAEKDEKKADALNQDILEKASQFDRFEKLISRAKDEL